MINFLIQAERVNGYLLPIHDFSYTLIEAIKYNNWFNNDKIYDYILHEEPFSYQLTLDNYIPIGSVEYVSSFIKEWNKVNYIKPINIPKSLHQSYTKGIKDYLKRDVYYNEYIISPHRFPNENYFIKDNSKIKGVSEFRRENDIKNFILGNKLSEFIISENIEIESEWRAFIYNSQLLDIKNYSGEFDVFPDIELVRNAIKDYKDSPPAYTMDFGINKHDGTFLIECHNFFSCGLYGFADYKNLPQMFIKAYKWQLEQK